MTDKYGYVDWPLEFSLYEKLLNNLEQCVDWIYDHTVNLFFNQGNQKVHVRIDPWDTWSMDHTLAPIILPMLQQLKDTKHGAHHVDNEDVPESLRANQTEMRNYKHDGSTDIHFFARWDWVLDEMIYAFDCKANKDDVFMRFENPEESAPEQERISNGFRLFGKYYEALWD